MSISLTPGRITLADLRRIYREQLAVKLERSAQVCH